MLTLANIAIELRGDGENLTGGGNPMWIKYCSKAIPTKLPALAADSFCQLPWESFQRTPDSWANGYICMYV